MAVTTAPAPSVRRARRRAAAPSAAPTPRLRPGDHLSLAEFDRRYAGAPDTWIAELIEGVVYMPSPVTDFHSLPHSDLTMWAGVYAHHTPGVVALSKQSVRIGGDNEVQPDVLLRRISGGGSQRTDDGYVQGPPELACEVSYTSATYDLHAKKALYERAGVQEYLVWRVEDEAIDWWRLEGGSYTPITPVADGIIESGVFPGLRLDVGAMLAGDGLAVLATLNAGIAERDAAATAAPP
ncbi:MAG: Uma2 family endonuclease [Armatimonadetes bacterium]|nr:Uma2 family endonuclease [Armatimonadota bacterium]